MSPIRRTLAPAKFKKGMLVGAMIFADVTLENDRILFGRTSIQE